MNQPGLLFDEAAKYARFAFLCGYLVANETQRPVWNKGDLASTTGKDEKKRAALPYSPNIHKALFEA